MLVSPARAAFVAAALPVTSAATLSAPTWSTHAFKRSASMPCYTQLDDALRSSSAEVNAAESTSRTCEVSWGVLLQREVLHGQHVHGAVGEDDVGCIEGLPTRAGPAVERDGEVPAQLEASLEGQLYARDLLR